MKFKIERDILLSPLNAAVSVVERRQTLPILSNVFLCIKDNILTIVGTDLEVETSVSIEVLDGENGSCTVTARKLLDICRALPESATLNFSTDIDKAKITAGRSRFTLQTLPFDEFPRLEVENWEERFKLSQKTLKKLFEKTSFSMAQQDVRYFLNGVLIELNESNITAVATDGHRLATSQATLSTENISERQVIVPRKAVAELNRFLSETEEEITIEINNQHISFKKPQAALISKLIDGKFPDYKAVMAQNLSQKLVADRQMLFEVLTRTAVLTNEKYRGVRLEFSKGSLKVSANNPEHEEAVDDIPVDYDGGNVEIGFNVTYLMDALKAIPSDKIVAELEDSNTGCMIHKPDDESTLYLIMPMRL
tara:strand:- start:374 stop:1474 length:1101 start_codon:yes stop_codon:yes gene_type:complete